MKKLSAKQVSDDHYLRDRFWAPTVGILGNVSPLGSTNELLPAGNVIAVLLLLGNEVVQLLHQALFAGGELCCGHGIHASLLLKLLDQTATSQQNEAQASNAVMQYMW